LKLLKINNQEYTVDSFGDAALTLRPISTSVKTASVAQHILSKKIKGVKEVIGTDHDITLILNKKPKKILAALAMLSWESVSPKIWEIPVCFEGFKDWERVEKETSISKADYISKLTAEKIEVGMFGFIPGFVYFTGLNKRMQVSRKPVPQTNTTNNVLAIGGPYIGIYSLPSPSGWNIIAKIPLKILEIEKERPIPFRIGDQIKLIPVSSEAFEKLAAKNQSIND
jgi:KipI family sensor histidine kinase inhibitor